MKKVLKNSFVEQSVVSGPCTFNVFPVMEKLKEVEVNLNRVMMPGSSCYSIPYCCSYWKSKPDDRMLHRSGLCCVNIGAVYGNCPNIEKFMGVEIGSISQEQTFSKWNTMVKIKFHQEYLEQGGSRGLKEWARSRWFCKRPVV